MADMSPEDRQAKLEEAQSIMEQLGVMSDQLDALLASAAGESKHVLELEKDLQDLKLLVSTSPSDDELELRFAEINKKIEHMATTYLRDRIEEAKKFEEVGVPIVTLLDQLLPLIDAYLVTDAEKEGMRESLRSNRSQMTPMLEEVPRFVNTVTEFLNNTQVEDKIITKENYETKIDEVIEWVNQVNKIIIPAGAAEGEVK